MARQISGKKPKNFGFTLKTLLSYMGPAPVPVTGAVAVLVTISALGNLLGTYMIRPVVNSVGAGDVQALVRGVALTVAIYGVGVLAAFGYTQTMVYAAQKSCTISAATCSPVSRNCRCAFLTPAATAIS